MVHDLIVIGGGILGAGIARDAAGRGARVLLLEANDLASGTSSASTKLIHGGLRYLEHREFGLVREALSERERLWRIAPHIIDPARFVLPLTPGMRSPLVLRAGLFLYDHLAASRTWPGTVNVDLSRHPAGEPLALGMRRAFEYSDGTVDDARLVVLTAKDAAEHGAEIRTYSRVRLLAREGNAWRVDTADGNHRARAIINAAGALADEIAVSAAQRTDLSIRRVRGSHIVTRRLFWHDFAYTFQVTDGRVAFVIPWQDDFTLIGTTDRDHAGPIDGLHATADEIDYLCREVSCYFRRPITTADIVHSFAGVRALIEDGSNKPEAATRGYRLIASDPVDGAPIVSVFGGKITSYRALAEETVNLLAQRMSQLRGRPWTSTQPLPGGDFAPWEKPLLIEQLQARYPFLAPPDARRIINAYGTRAPRWLGQAQSWDDLGRDFGGGLSEAEADYLRREEWAKSTDDVLWRRTKKGLRLDSAQKDALSQWFSS